MGGHVDIVRRAEVDIVTYPRFIFANRVNDFDLYIREWSIIRPNKAALKRTAA
jgi:hypothetical protein